MIKEAIGMKSIFISLVVMLLSGCASFMAENVDNKIVYPPNNPESVKIFNEEPNKPYIVIGEITAEGETLSRSDTMEQRLKDKAALMGADAVIFKVQERKPGMRANNMVEGNSYVYNYNEIFAKKMTGKAIRFNK
ncbi:MAG: hypothetical protein WC412_05195 [Candidatus Omnitrophota bacterium]|jgi:hypothetical protein